MIPSSTYRIQFGPDMGFSQAKDSVAPYLRRLGVGALYASPLLQATPGSTHGYDVTDPTSVSAGLGGAMARQLLHRRLTELGLGFVVDIVPNHVGIAVPQANPWWWDVLRHGRESVHADKFDIDWSRGPLLVPVLGDDGLDDLRVEQGKLVYYEHMFPLAPATEGGTAQEVHERQHYRLVHWRTANTDLNYRRFFDITTLAAVRVEDPAVFEATHREVLSWGVDGLRIDHPDGLSDPGAYMRRLRDAAPEAWIVVEKILGVGESLPVSWPVAGTTGYDALREVCGLFIDPAGEPESPEPLHELEKRCRSAAASTILRAEVRADQRPAALRRRGRRHRAAVLVPGLPQLPAGGPASRWSGRCRAAPRAAEIARPMIADPRGELATRPVPADLRHGDGQGRRGHRVLPLQPVRRR